MFGRLLGEVLAFPARVVNAPVRAINKLADDEVVPETMGDVADAIEDTTADLLGDKDK